MAEDEDPNTISKIEKNKANPKKENLDMVIASSKYAVGGESSEVPASGLDDNDSPRSNNTIGQSDRKISTNIMNCKKCGKKLDPNKEIPLCNDCERIHD